MRTTDRPESFQPLGGPVKPTTATTKPAAPVAVPVNRAAGVFAGADGKFFTGAKS